MRRRYVNDYEKSTQCFASTLKAFSMVLAVFTALTTLAGGVVAWYSFVGGKRITELNSLVENVRSNAAYASVAEEECRAKLSEIKTSNGAISAAARSVSNGLWQTCPAFLTSDAQKYLRTGEFPVQIAKYIGAQRRSELFRSSDFGTRLWSFMKRDGAVVLAFRCNETPILQSAMGLGSSSNRYTNGIPSVLMPETLFRYYGNIIVTVFEQSYISDTTTFSNSMFMITYISDPAETNNLQKVEAREHENRLLLHLDGMRTDYEL